MPRPSLPESTLGTPDDANDTEGVHSVAHSIRLHGALLRTVDYAGHTRRRTRRRVPQSRAYPQSAVPALGDIEAFALQQYFLIDTFCVLMFRFDAHIAVST